MTKDSDSTSETVTVTSGTEIYRFNNIILGELYTLSSRTRDDSNNWSASLDTVISTSAFTDITQNDVYFSGSKGYQYNYDYSVSEQIILNWYYYEEADGDGKFNDPNPGDSFGCSSYLYTYNSENRLISFSGFADAAHSQIKSRYDFSYNTDMTLQSIIANFDMDASGLIGDIAGETGVYTYLFNYTSSVLGSIDLTGSFGGDPIHHRYTFTNNINDKPTQALLYFDAVNLTLDTDPSFKWDFTYDGNGRVSIIERSSDADDLDGVFTYLGKNMYEYNPSGTLDSVPGYNQGDVQETEMDFIY